MNPLTQAWGPLLGEHQPDWLALYRDIHQHPELSMQETRTAGLVDQRLRATLTAAAAWLCQPTKHA